MNRNRLIIGSALLITIVILAVFLGGLLLVKSKNREPQINQGSPIPSLAYCSSSQARPCIVSFSLDADERMLVNVLVPPSFPDFYLNIKRTTGENRYECQKVEGFPTSVSCIGAKMPPGEILQFMIFSGEDNALLAEGSFAIIGLELPTPVVILTLPTSSEQPTASPTLNLLFTETPKPIQSTPSPSYPNPSYPNSSYP